jgi:hypothetical protein
MQEVLDRTQNIQQAQQTHKYCKICGQWKPVNEYHNIRRNKDGLGHYCKVCSNKQGREAKQRQIEREGEAYFEKRRKYLKEFKEKDPEWYNKIRRNNFMAWLERGDNRKLHNQRRATPIKTKLMRIFKSIKNTDKNKNSQYGRYFNTDFKLTQKLYRMVVAHIDKKGYDLKEINEKGIRSCEKSYQVKHKKEYQEA